jgi:2-polyprenyl-3-methyl-5-hydroxy-6-metoxy-1,4-benzoquinol methylase
MSMSEMQRAYWDGLSARYQRVMEISTDDFHYGPQIPGEGRLRLLPPLKPGMRALELGCGGGQNSVWLAKSGLSCDAFDISAEQLKHARTLARREGVEIVFEKGELDRWPARFKGPYDLIHSSHALEFADDPASVIVRAARALRPGGTFVISTVHPLYNGDWVEGVDEKGDPNGMGLFLRNYFSPPDDIRRKNGRVEVISRAYPISSWFRWMRNAGLDVVAIEEPPELDETLPNGTKAKPPYTNVDWANTEGELAAIPGTLILVARLGHEEIIDSR